MDRCALSDNNHTEIILQAELMEMYGMDKLQ